MDRWPVQLTDWGTQSNSHMRWYAFSHRSGVAGLIRWSQWRMCRQTGGRASYGDDLSIGSFPRACMQRGGHWSLGGSPRQVLIVRDGVARQVGLDLYPKEIDRSVCCHSVLIVIGYALTVTNASGAVTSTPFQGLDLAQKLCGKGCFAPKAFILRSAPKRRCVSRALASRARLRTRSCS